MTTDAASLAGFLALVESYGSAVLSSRALDAVVATEARAALHVAGVLSGAPPAASWPCETRGCAREIRANHDGARKPLLAVCSQAPAACAAVELAFDEVAQVEIASDALVVAACTALGAAVDRAAVAKVRERRPVGDARMPLLVATLESPARDVFWASAPRDMDLSSFCARRERVTRGSLVLVPTNRHVPLEVMARFAPGEHVEIRPLGDVLCVKDGQLLAIDAPREDRLPPVDAPTTAPPPAAPHGLAARLGVTSWESIRMFAVDDSTLRIEANGQSLLRTFVELGFVDRRKTEVTPVISWGLLIFFCRRGALRPSEYGQFGKPYAVKKAVQAIGTALRGSFGLKEHPIRQYSELEKLWMPRFRTGGEAKKEKG